MAYASWPSNIPQYVQEGGYSDQMPDQLLVSQMEAGKPKTRRRYTAGGNIFTCTVTMTVAEKQLFEDFYNDTLRGGSLPFTWVHPLYRTAMNFMFRKPVPRWSVRGNAHMVSFAMEEVI